MRRLKSRPLEDGAAVGIIAPASPVGNRDDIDKACSYLIQSGYKPVLGRTAEPKTGYLSGSDGERLADLETMWAEPSIRAIWTLRGGYGCLRLLERVNFRLMADFPKIIIGYSDITALEVGLWTCARLVTFHGPVLLGMENAFSRKWALDLLRGVAHETELTWPDQSDRFYAVFRPGRIRGRIIGGNLATLVSLVGTKYFPDLGGMLLLIEETGEAAYRIDRMLTQLILSGVLDDVAGVLVGRSIPLPSEDESQVVSVFAERLSRLKCPSAYGFPIGHCREQWTIPQGIMAEIDIDAGMVSLLESPFADQS